MSTIHSEVQIMHAERNGVRAPYLFDGDDVCDFYTYSKNEHGQKVDILPFPDAEEKARFAAAAWKTILHIAERLGVDPLKLAESGAVELMCEHYAKGTVLDIMNSRHRVDRALTACRQTEGVADAASMGVANPSGQPAATR